MFIVSYLEAIATVDVRSVCNNDVKLDRHITWSSKPRKGPAACRAKGVPSFLSYLKTLSIGPAPGIEPATSRSALKRSTDWANHAAVRSIQLIQLIQCLESRNCLGFRYMRRYIEPAYLRFVLSKNMCVVSPQNQRILSRVSLWLPPVLKPLPACGFLFSGRKHHRSFVEGCNFNSK